MIVRANLIDELTHLINGILFRRELIGLPFGFGIAEIRRRLIIPNAPRRFFSIVFPLDDRKLIEFRDLPRCPGKSA